MRCDHKTRNPEDFGVTPPAAPFVLRSWPLVPSGSRGVRWRRTVRGMKAHPLVHKVARYCWREWIRPLALPLLLIASAKSAIADINFVPSGSMKPTIVEGDVVFVNKLAYDLRVPFTTVRLARWSEPARGDIVVCFSPDDGTRLVKRVIGLPGDTVELRHSAVFINGVRQEYEPLPATATRDLAEGERQQSVFATERLGARAHAVMGLPRVPAVRDFGPVTVPAGQCFVMGDNRDNSKDSRFFGFVARAEVVGEATGVFVSANPNRWLRPRFGRFFTGLE